MTAVHADEFRMVGTGGSGGTGMPGEFKNIGGGSVGGLLQYVPNFENGGQSQSSQMTRTVGARSSAGAESVSHLSC